MNEVEQFAKTKENNDLDVLKNHHQVAMANEKKCNAKIHSQKLYY